MTQTLFAAVELAPRDPILGLTEAFNADTRATKVNLGVGVYYDDNGKIPLLGAVREAEKVRLEGAPARGYLPIDGIAAYDKAVQGLVFGAESEAVASGRIATVQGLSRQVALDIYAAVATWQAVVRSRSSTTPPLFRKLASTSRSR